jgi:hypothetical protein
MRRIARFTIYAKLDDASRAQLGTVTISRETGLVAIRPKRRRKVYEFLLSDICSLAVRQHLRAEAAGKRAIRRQQRRSRFA